MENGEIALSRVTLVVEWENPRDMDMEWPRRAMRGLADELARCAADSTDPNERPSLLYLFDREVLDAGSIRRTIDAVAPDLYELTDLQIVPTEGLSYYELKNRGAELATTPYVAFIDSDIVPMAGWLRGLLRPFADPAIMAVSGSTSLGASNLLSRTMALVWIFDLPSEHEASRGRAFMHANNCAVRTAFFNAHPFPSTLAFKKQCGIWLAQILERGAGFERTAEAQCLHAPHSGYLFLLWRALQAGMDRDAKARLEGRRRPGRLIYAFRVLLKKLWRSAHRILRFHGEVRLPLWQLPAALGLASAYYLALSVGQICSVVMDGVPTAFRLRWIESA